MLRFAPFLFPAATTFAADLVLKPGNLAAVLEQARKAPKPVRIVVEDGVHPIAETITLGKDDSQVTWSGKNWQFLEVMHLSEISLSIAGGVILFMISIRMVFPSAGHKESDAMVREPLLVPLAIPLTPVRLRWPRSC